MINRERPSHPVSAMRRMGRYTAAALGFALIMFAADSCSQRASFESASPGNLHGFGYDIDASALGPNTVRVTSRRTLLPFQGEESSRKKAFERLNATCGSSSYIELATANAATNWKSTGEGVIIDYASVPNRLACLEE